MSEPYGPLNLRRLTEAEMQRIIEEHAAKKNGTHQPKRGELVLNERVTEDGVRVREWSGPKSAWMDAYKSPLYLQTGFRFKEGMNKGSGAPIDQDSARWNFLKSTGQL